MEHRTEGEGALGSSPALPLHSGFERHCFSRSSPTSVTVPLLPTLTLLSPAQWRGFTPGIICRLSSRSVLSFLFSHLWKIPYLHTVSVIALFRWPSNLYLPWTVFSFLVPNFKSLDFSARKYLHHSHFITCSQTHPLPYHTLHRVPTLLILHMGLYPPRLQSLTFLQVPDPVFLHMGFNAFVNLTFSILQRCLFRSYTREFKFIAKSAHLITKQVSN